jgi:UDP-N-acetylmuramate dehydrogenase
MNAARIIPHSWMDTLPQVRGRLSFNQPLGPFTWFRVGGPADVVFKPADQEDLAGFLRCLPPEVPVITLGVGSNLLVRDGGVRGVVIRLGGNFNHLSFDTDSLTVSAAGLDQTVAQSALDRGRAGLEFLSGIPGTIGGALRMNAGAYGREMKDVVIGATAIDRHGAIHSLSCDDMGFGYRHSDLAEDWIFLSATLAAPPGDHDAINQKMIGIKAARQSAQPIRARTGGSTFANPPNQRAWELIDQAGCRGLKRGGAMISEKHCNFMINTGTATATDLEDLGDDVRDRVFKTSGLRLEWEIRRIGERS